MKFQVLIEGFGFEGTFEGSKQRVGFFTTRIIEADEAKDLDETSLLAILQSELKDLYIEPTAQSYIRIAKLQRADESGSAIGGFSFFIDDSNVSSRESSTP